jgi:hypothetical protein
MNCGHWLWSVNLINSVAGKEDWEGAKVGRLDLFQIGEFNLLLAKVSLFARGPLEINQEDRN